MKRYFLLSLFVLPFLLAADCDHCQDPDPGPSKLCWADTTDAQCPPGMCLSAAEPRVCIPKN